MNMVLRWWTGRFYMLRPRNMAGHSTCESSMSTLVRPARAQILVSSLDSANRGLAGGLLTRNLTSSNEYPAFLAAGKTKIPAIRADPSSWYSSGKCLAPWRNNRKKHWASWQTAQPMLVTQRKERNQTQTLQSQCRMENINGQSPGKQF
jgi:hypothetical protein